jgi:hypothetical protein
LLIQFLHFSLLRIFPFPHSEIFSTIFPEANVVDVTCSNTEPTSGSSVLRQKDERPIHTAGFSIEKKQYPFIPASSVHLDLTDAA